MAAHVAMMLKHPLAVRRPDQMDPRLMPMIPVPGHGSFPSAHATEAYAVMTVMKALTKRWGTLSDQNQRAAVLHGLAERITVNRTVAGVHYPIDSWCGAALGQIVGNIILNRCGVGTDIAPQRYVPASRDFFDDDLQDTSIALAAGLTRVAGPATRPAKANAFDWIWQEALAEKQGS